MAAIAGEAEEQLRSLPGVGEAAVEIVWIALDSNMISPAGAVGCSRQARLRLNKPRACSVAR